jgi:hypothetical protein
VPFVRSYRNIWYSQAGHTWQYNTAHALCMLENWSYEQALRTCNTYRLSTAPVIPRKHHNITSYIYIACRDLFPHDLEKAVIYSYYVILLEAGWDSLYSNKFAGWTTDVVVWFLVAAKDLSGLQEVQTTSGTHPAVSSVGTGCISGT